MGKGEAELTHTIELLELFNVQKELWEDRKEQWERDVKRYLCKKS